MRWLYYYLLIIAFITYPLKIQAADTLKDIPESKKVVESNQFTWEDKKFAIGMGGASGIGFGPKTNGYPLISWLQIDLRTWLTPSIQISMHGSANYDLRYSLFVPILLNFGYSKTNGNRHWFIEAGGGFEIGHVNTYAMADIGTGMEWLISKSYAIGVKSKIGYLFGDNYFNFNALFLDLSITANLVF